VLDDVEQGDGGEMSVGKGERFLGAAGGDDRGGALSGGGDCLRRELEAIGFVAGLLQGLEEEAEAGADVEDAATRDAMGAQQADQIIEVLALAGVELKVLAIEVVIGLERSRRTLRWRSGWRHARMLAPVGPDMLVCTPDRCARSPSAKSGSR
jgi:hypothetical protein